MSYQQYSGNPYGNDGYGDSNPYGGQSTTGAGYGSSNPYGGQAPPLQHHDSSNYSQDPSYTEMGNLNAPPQAAPRVLGNDEFLARVDGCKKRIRQLTSQIGEITTVHQRLLADTAEAGAHSQLEHLATQTSLLNSQIKDEIKFLETDAVRSGGNVTKDSQVRNLKNSFKAELQSYQDVEKKYRDRYAEQIRRQIYIVNPEATDAEVEQALSTADGPQQIFASALQSNRSAHANSVLGSVRARHNDLQRIEKSMEELAELFIQLNEQVVLQEPQVQRTEEQTENVLEQGKQAHVELDKGIEHIKRRNRLRRWTLFVFILIICIIALVLGLYFGLKAKNDNNNTNNTNNSA
ncbi:snare domain-containing protein [Diplodia corticola]|uniref:Snare domain-containing protein n=1 Tax=Diplodia corticola TaxID=236234 RepID=A0A1J9S0P6_9PEZI|nr:snare domain-containing protein [Diplodia corticola]OJD33237.1 snare domain-containing protein [Diplodia corticola]